MSETPRTDAGYKAHYAEHENNRALCERLERDLAAVTAERDALRADAERYRWLRHGDNDAIVMHFSMKTMAGPDDVWLLREEELDAAIDAARAEEFRKSSENPSNSETSVSGK